MPVRLISYSSLIHPRKPINRIQTNLSSAQPHGTVSVILFRLSQLFCWWLMTGRARWSLVEFENLRFLLNLPADSGYVYPFCFMTLTYLGLLPSITHCVCERLCLCVPVFFTKEGCSLHNIAVLMCAAVCHSDSIARQRFGAIDYHFSQSAWICVRSTIELACDWHLFGSDTGIVFITGLEDCPEKNTEWW